MDILTRVYVEFSKSLDLPLNVILWFNLMSSGKKRMIGNNVSHSLNKDTYPYARAAYNKVAIGLSQLKIA